MLGKRMREVPENIIGITFLYDDIMQYWKWCGIIIIFLKFDGKLFLSIWLWNFVTTITNVDLNKGISNMKVFLKFIVISLAKETSKTKDIIVLWHL